MSGTQDQYEQTERFILTGALEDPALRPWILGHAARLGVVADIMRHDGTELSMAVRGPRDLLDAMEAGCLLGPIGTWVESIRREVRNPSG